MLGETQQIREFIETSLWTSGSASLVAAMVNFVERNDEIPCLRQFNQALAQMSTPLVLDEGTHTLKIGDLGAEQIELTLAQLMAACDRYIARLGSQREDFVQRVYSPLTERRVAKKIFERLGPVPYFM
jgi:hypothetical protein